MRKYRGSQPTIISDVLTVGDRVLVTTNDGGKYFVKPEYHPTKGECIYSYHFSRAHPQTFEQQSTSFHRVVDGYRLPFFEYTARAGSHSLDHLEAMARECFIEQMAKQNVAARII